jgi:succinate-acetate transporter protein
VLGRALGSPVEYLARVDLLMVLAMWIVYLLVAFVITTPKQRMLVVAVLLGLTIVHVVLSGIQYCRGIGGDLQFSATV